MGTTTLWRVLGCLLAAVPAAAATDHPIPGKTLAVKPARVMKLVSRSVFPLPAYGTAEDPTLHGADLRVFDTGGAAGDVAYRLPASGWRALGFPLGSRGYRYRGSRAVPPDPHCQSAFIGRSAIKAVCKGGGVTLQPPFAGDAAVLLAVPAGTASGLAAGTAAAVRYCAEFGGLVARNDRQLFKARHAVAPAACAPLPAPPTPGEPTATPTTTPSRAATATPSASRTPTATVPAATATPMLASEQTCPLASSSKLEINSQAFPLSLEMSGSLRLASDPPDGGGNATTRCEVEQIDPINIPSIGYVCVEPADGCPNGVADCDGGTPLGVDLRGNGNVGACTGNADCAANCASFCTGTGRAYRASGCTGHCSASERPCTRDNDCAAADEGACNGPEPVDPAQAAICQCQCIDLRAGAPGAAGELQCELGANINLENGPPCGDGDIKVAIGRTCLPLTTATATTQIENANFSANSVPASPASNTGDPLTCAALSTDVAGLQLRGVANFFGSTLGDLAVELFADCE